MDKSEMCNPESPHIPKNEWVPMTDKDIREMLNEEIINVFGYDSESRRKKVGKKLKIQFWRVEKALAMQILEQEGLPERKTEGFIRISDCLCMCSDELHLRGYSIKEDFYVENMIFPTNFKRDTYLQKVVNAITDELFTGEGELKIGKMCEVSDNEDWIKFKTRVLLAILPERCESRYIVSDSDEPIGWKAYAYARPFTKYIEPTIEECGNVITYTWEQ